MRRTWSARLSAPFVWTAAVLWLVAQSSGDALGRGLDAWDRAANAAGRAVARWARALVRALGPLGRAVLRLTAPLRRALRRLWDRLAVWLLLRLFRPLGRLGRWAFARVRPVVERLTAWVRRLTDVVEPVLRTLTRGVEAVERAAGRLGAWLSRRAEPVRRAVRAARSSLSRARARA